MLLPKELPEQLQLVINYLLYKLLVKLQVVTKQFQSVKLLLQSCQLSLDYHKIFPHIVFNNSNYINNVNNKVSKVLVSYPDVSNKASSDKNHRTWLSEWSPGVTEDSRLIFTPFENFFWHATLEINLLC